MALPQEVEKLYQRLNKLERRLAALFLVFLITFILGGNAIEWVRAAAAPPTIFTYQARALDTSGNPVADSSYEVNIAFFDAASGGNCLWTWSDEDSSASTDDCTGYSTDGDGVSVSTTDGLFTIYVGETGSGYNNPDETIFDGDDTLYLEVTFDNDTLSPRKQVVSSPFALNASMLDGLDWTDQITMTGDPSGTGVGDGSLYINPAAPGAGETIFSVANNGSSRFLVDAEGDTTIEGDVTLTSGGSITTTSNGDLTFLPNGTGITVVGDAGSTSHSLATNDDLFISDELEVDGVAYFDGTIEIEGPTDGASEATLYFTENGSNRVNLRANYNYNQFVFGLNSNIGSQMIIASASDTGANFDHGSQTNPTLFIQSGEDPDVDNTQWLSFAHNQTDAVIATGSGDLVFNPGADTDDYIYLETASDTAYMYWSGTGVATNDPGIRVNTSTQELEYRDEDDASWSTFDSLSGVTGSGAANQMTYWSDTTVLTGNSNFTYDGTDLALTLPATGSFALDAATTDSTETSGVLALTVDSTTDGNEAIYIDYEVIDDGTASDTNGQIALNIDLTQSSNDGDDLVGLNIGDLSGTASSGFELGAVIGTGYDFGMMSNSAVYATGTADMGLIGDSTRTATLIVNGGSSTHPGDNEIVVGSRVINQSSMDPTTGHTLNLYGSEILAQYAGSDTDSSLNAAGLYVQGAFTGGTGTNNVFGIDAYAQELGGTVANAYGIRATANTATTLNYGGYFVANSATTNISIYAENGSADNPSIRMVNNGDSETMDIFVGDTTPAGSVSAHAGSLYLQDTNSTGQAWLNTTGGGSKGTTWTQLLTSVNTTLDDAYNNHGGAATIAVDAGTVTWDLSSASDFVIDSTGVGSDFIIQAGGSDFFTATNNQELTYVTGNLVGGSAFTINAAAATGANAVIDLDANALTTGTLIDLDSTSGSLTSGDFIAATHNATYSGTTTLSGNLLDLTRNIELNGAGETLTVSGPLVTLANTMTETDGTLTDTSTLLNIDQNYTSASGNVVDILNEGTGNGILIDQDGNGVALSLDSEAASQPLINLLPLATPGRGVLALSNTLSANPSSPSEGDAWYYDDAFCFWDGSNNVCLDNSVTAGSSLWTEGTTVTYLTDSAEDLTLGAGDTATAPFNFDVSANSFRIGDGTSDANDPTITFYASDATDDGSLSFTDNDSFYFNNAEVGIGTNNPSSALHVIANSPSVSASALNGSISSVSKTTSGTSVGIWNALEVANTSSSASPNYGLNSFAYHTGTANLTSQYALIGGRYASRVNSNGSTITGANGASAYVEISNGYSSTITNARAFYAESIDAEDSTITNAYEIYVSDPTSDTGSVTNAYGLYLEAITEGTSNNYAIYSGGGDSYHAGDFGIGDTSPDAQLDVEGSSAATAAAINYSSRVSYADTGVVTTGTDTNYGHTIEMTRTGATGGTINTYGQYIDITTDNAGGGTHTAYGVFVQMDGNADNNYAAVFDSGNVGIGQTAPDNATLEIQENAASLNLLRLDALSGVDSNVLLVSNASTGGAGIKVENSSAAGIGVYIDQQHTTNPALRIDSVTQGGNVLQISNSPASSAAAVGVSVDVSSANNTGVGLAIASGTNSRAQIALGTGVTDDPGTTTEGDLWYQNDIDSLCFYDGSADVCLDSSTGGSNITGSGSTGQVTYWDASGITGESDFTWDDSTNALGLGSSPSITTSSNTNLTLLPNGTGYTRVGDAGTSDHSLGEDDLYVSDRLEVDGPSFFDSSVYYPDSNSNFLGSGSDSGWRWSTQETNDSMMFFTDTNNANFSGNIMFANKDYRTTDHGVPIVADPTIRIFSGADPGVDSTQWLSFAHNQTDAVIAAGSGNIVLQPNADTDDYIRLETTTNIPYLLFENGVASDGGFRSNGGDIEYRDDGGSWIAFNSLGGDSDWSEESSPAAHVEAKSGGITTNGATIYGTGASTHINLGFGTSVTGTSGQNYYYITVGGGYNNTASNTNSTVGGGASNNTASYGGVIAGGEANTTSSGQYLSVLGGYGNDITAGNYGTIVGGYNSGVSGTYGTVGGGYQNTVNNTSGVVSGGSSNTAGQYASVGGGNTNTATASYSTISGGQSNDASQSYSVIGGGNNNTASAFYATVGGGYNNVASGANSTVAGGGETGAGNTASGDGSAILGGTDNTASGNYSSVLGGYGNTAGGTHSSVLGGQYVSIATGADRVFAYGYTGSSTIDIPNTTDDAFLIFPNDGAQGTYGEVGIGVIAPSAKLDISNPSADAMPGIEINQANTAEPHLSLLGITADPSSLAEGDVWYEATDGEFCFYDGSTSVCLDSAIGGGDSDWTELTSPANHIRAKSGGIIVNGATVYGTNATSHINLGFNSSVTGTSGQNYSYITVSGGSQNTATNTGATIGGGHSNDASGTYSTISGGYNVTASNSYVAVGGGISNSAAGYANVIAGGESNTIANVLNGSVVGGYGNDITAGNYGTIVGGYNSGVSGTYGFIGGGYQNTVNNTAGAVAGGQSNTAGQYAFVGSGSSNTSTGQYSAISGGTSNNASANYSFIGGGNNNTASQVYATVGGGFNNTASGISAVVAGGGGTASANTASGDYSGVLGGQLNTASANHSAVIGGYGNTAAGLRSVAAGQYVDIESGADNVFAFGYDGSAAIDIPSTTDNAFLVFPNDGTNGTYGSLAIGTITPAARLDVNYAASGGATAVVMSALDLDLSTSDQTAAITGLDINLADGAVDSTGTNIGLNVDTTGLSGGTEIAGKFISNDLGIQIDIPDSPTRGAINLDAPATAGPSAPSEGDLWYYNDELCYEASGSTVCLDSSAGSGITGSGADTRISYWTGTSSQSGEAAFTYDDSTNFFTLDGSAAFGTNATAANTLIVNVDDDFVASSGAEHQGILVAGGPTSGSTAGLTTYDYAGVWADIDAGFATASGNDSISAYYADTTWAGAGTADGVYGAKLYATATGAAGLVTGVRGYGDINGGSATTVYGGDFVASVTSGSATDAYGLFAAGSGATSNYSIYTGVGNVYVQDGLIVGDDDTNITDKLIYATEDFGSTGLTRKGMEIDVQKTGSYNINNVIYGLDSYVYMDGNCGSSAGTCGTYGIYNEVEAETTKSGSMQNYLYGEYTKVDIPNSTSLTMNAIYGKDIDVDVSNANASVTNLYGQRIATDTSGGSATNVYGSHITAAGGTTNNYGMWISADGATNDLAIYADEGDVYIEDSVRIGNAGTTPGDNAYLYISRDMTGYFASAASGTYSTVDVEWEYSSTNSTSDATRIGIDNWLDWDGGSCTDVSSPDCVAIGFRNDVDYSTGYGTGTSTAYGIYQDVNISTTDTINVSDVIGIYAKTGFTNSNATITDDMIGAEILSNITVGTVSDDIIGVYASAVKDGGTVSGNMIGSWNLADVNTGSAPIVYGAFNSGRWDSSTNLITADIYGAQSQAVLTSEASVDNLIGEFAWGYASNASGSVDEIAGLWASAQPTGSVTTGAYGVHSRATKLGSTSGTGYGGWFKADLFTTNVGVYVETVDTDSVTLELNQDGNGKVIDIDAESTTADVIYVDALATTTGRPLYIETDISFNDGVGMIRLDHDASGTTKDMFVIETDDGSADTVKFRVEGTGDTYVGDDLMINDAATAVEDSYIYFSDGGDVTTTYLQFDDNSTDLFDHFEFNQGLVISSQSNRYALQATTDDANGYAADFQNDGNNVNRWGIRIQAGEDVESGTNYYLRAYDGDGSAETGGLRSVGGTFAVYNTSDERLKTNIVDTTIEGLSVINQIQVRDYNWLENPYGPINRGFIAQELLTAYPDMVEYNADDDLYSISPSYLIPVLVKAVQEMSDEVLNQDGVFSTFDENISLTAIGTADAVDTGFDSYDLMLRGSAWNGTQAVDRQMKIVTTVDDADNYRLSVKNTVDTEVAYVDQGGTMMIAGDLIISGKIYPTDQGTAQTDKYIYYDGSAGLGGDYMRTNAAGWGTGSYDFAEMFPSTEVLEAGQVVVMAGDAEHIRLSDAAYSAKLIGVVSTKPGFLAGDNNTGDYPVALAGRVPVFVNDENGPIAIGDPLTSSSVPGEAMKAIESGRIIGYALEPYSGTGTGRVIVYVESGWYGGGPVAETPGTDNTASTTGGGSSSNFTSLTMNGNIYMTANEILDVGAIHGIQDRWSVDEVGAFKTEGSYSVAIESYQGDTVEAQAVLSTAHKVVTTGTSQLSSGMAQINFEDHDPAFNDIISTIEDYRVFVTLTDQANGVYVTNKTNGGFTVIEVMGGSSDATFDWMVEAYRKDYEPVAAVCGNGMIEEGEACDDGNTVDGDGCSAMCELEVVAECGNGEIEEGEACDDGNVEDGDGCSSLCEIETVAECGNGVTEDPEQCDDGNLEDGDGCSAICEEELPPEEPPAEDPPAGPVCGDGTTEAPETCDDGNTEDGDGCSSLCEVEAPPEEPPPEDPPPEDPPVI